MRPGIGRNDWKTAMKKAKELAAKKAAKSNAPTPFRMRRQGGEIDRASETSDLAYSNNQVRTMNNMGMADQGMNYGTPALYPDDEKEKVQVGKNADNKLDEVVVSAPSVETLNKKAQHLVENTTQFNDKVQIGNEGLRNVAKGSNSQSLKSLSPKNKERLNRALSGADGTRTIEMMERANARKEGLL